MRSTLLRVWLPSFVPAPLAATRRDLLLGSMGAGLALLMAEWVSHQALGSANPWFVAPMGASAVLLLPYPPAPWRSHGPLSEATCSRRWWA